MLKGFGWFKLVSRRNKILCFINKPVFLSEKVLTEK